MSVFCVLATVGLIKHMTILMHVTNIIEAGMKKPTKKIVMKKHLRNEPVSTDKVSSIMSNVS